MEVKRKVKEYEMTFMNQSKVISVQCQEMIGFAKVPMVRVYVPTVKNEGQVYIFYRVEKNKLFWFKWNNLAKDKTAKKIVDALNNLKSK